MSTGVDMLPELLSEAPFDHRLEVLEALGSEVLSRGCFNAIKEGANPLKSPVSQGKGVGDRFSVDRLGLLAHGYVHYREDERLISEERDGLVETAKGLGPRAIPSWRHLGGAGNFSANY